MSIRSLYAKHSDKFGHFAGGSIIASVLSLLGTDAVNTLAAVAIVALSKELYDRQHPDKHTYDLWDAFWTVAGTAPLLLWRLYVQS